MTMTREEKAGRTETMKRIISGEAVKAQSPKLRAAMVADHGHPTYTPRAWREERMGRGQMSACRLDLKIENRRSAKIRSWRKITKH